MREQVRVFKKYAPRQIAKYVCDFFKGTFNILGIGLFSFEGGRVIIKGETSQKRLTVCREINSAIRDMTCRLQMS